MRLYLCTGVLNLDVNPYSEKKWHGKILQRVCWFKKSLLNAANKRYLFWVKLRTKPQISLAKSEDRSGAAAAVKFKK